MILDAARSRWLVIGVFVLSSTINYLDRQTLAVVWPAIRDEFHLTYSDYGWIIAAFYVPYAIGAKWAHPDRPAVCFAYPSPRAVKLSAVAVVSTSSIRRIAPTAVRAASRTPRTVRRRSESRQ